MPKINDVIRALEIFRDADAGEVWIEAGHDELYGPSEREANLNDEQRVELDSLGWHLSSEYDCWMAST